MNRHIFCNNFLTSAQLAEDLLRNNLYHRWTTHFNRSDFPANLRPGEISLPKGESLFRHKGGVVATVWKDKKLVLSSACSTKCKDNCSSAYSSCCSTLQQVHVGSWELRLATKCLNIMSVLDKQRSGGGTFCGSVWTCLLLMCIYRCWKRTTSQIYPGTVLPWTGQNAFSDFTSQKQNVQDGEVHANHWPVPITKGWCKWCLKNGKTTFCQMGGCI